MRAAVDLLRRERSARLFFVAHAQSSLGTGAGYVGLLVLAYERFESPWALTLVLLADFLPAMFLGPVFGAAADRWSRRWCAVVADLARGVAFVAVGFVSGFEATVLLALLAGAGTGLFTPAVLSGLPSLVARERLPAATSLYGAISDLGHTVGPALAAGAFLIVSPEALLIVNGVTFLASAGIMAALRFGDAPAADTAMPSRSLLAEARHGLKATAAMPGVRVVVLASSAVLLFAGMINVGELLLATEDLGSSESGFSALVALYGLGIVVGSLLVSVGNDVTALKRRYLSGLLIMAVGMLGSGLAPVFLIAAGTFFLSGLGNGLVLVHERLLFQSAVPDELMGRVFGVKDALMSWAFGVAFLSAGAIVALVGTRELFLLAGAGAALVWLVTKVALARAWADDSAPRAGARFQEAGAES